MRLSRLSRVVTTGAMLTAAIAFGAVTGAYVANGQDLSTTLAQAGPPGPGGGPPQPGAGATVGPGQPGMMGRWREGEKQRRRAHMMKVIFAVADANGDGALTFEEVTDIHRRIFNGIDTNKDGMVTLEEIQAFAGH